MQALLSVVAVLAIILKLGTIILHSVGLYLLNCLPDTEKGKVQTIYIMNLSITELIINSISFLRNILKLLPWNLRELIEYSYVFDYAVLKFGMQTTMIIITFDRMLLIVLNVKYPYFLNAHRAKMIILGIWSTSAVIFTIYILSYIYVFDKSSSKSCMVFNQVCVAFDFLFLFVAVIDYCLIFRTLFEQKRNSCIYTSDSIPRRSVWRAFRRSRFYVAFFLIITFAVFGVPPDLVYAFYACTSSPPKEVHYSMTILYTVSYLSDGLVYIFMNDKVRDLFLRKCRRVWERVKWRTGCYSSQMEGRGAVEKMLLNLAPSQVIPEVRETIL